MTTSGSTSTCSTPACSRESPSASTTGVDRGGLLPPREPALHHVELAPPPGGSRSRAAAGTGRAGPRAAGRCPRTRSGWRWRARGTGGAATNVRPSTVTCPSCIASSSADCVFGGVRLISSASSRPAITGPGWKTNSAPSGVVDERPGDVGGQQVGRALQPTEVEPERGGQAAGRQRLAGAGHVLDQHVTAGQHGGQREPQAGVLAHHRGPTASRVARRWRPPRPERPAAGGRAGRGDRWRRAAVNGRLGSSVRRFGGSIASSRSSRPAGQGGGAAGRAARRGDVHQQVVAGRRRAACGPAGWRRSTPGRRSREDGQVAQPGQQGGRDAVGLLVELLEGRGRQPHLVPPGALVDAPARPASRRGGRAARLDASVTRRRRARGRQVPEVESRRTAQAARTGGEQGEQAGPQPVRREARRRSGTARRPVQRPGDRTRSSAARVSAPGRQAAAAEPGPVVQVQQVVGRPRVGAQRRSRSEPYSLGVSCGGRGVPRASALLSSPSQQRTTSSATPECSPERSRTAPSFRARRSAPRCSAAGSPAASLRGLLRFRLSRVPRDPQQGSHRERHQHRHQEHRHGGQPAGCRELAAPRSRSSTDPVSVLGGVGVMSRC